MFLFFFCATIIPSLGQMEDFSLNQTAFDLIAQGMRYWFLFLIALLFVQLLRCVLRESKSDRVLKKQAANRSMGLLEVVAPADNKRLYGVHFALRQENLLGRSRRCDIRLKDPSVRPAHAFIAQKGKKVVLSRYGGATLLNGTMIKSEVPLLDGDEIQLGQVVLRVCIASAAPRQAADFTGMRDTSGIPSPVRQQSGDPYESAESFVLLSPPNLVGYRKGGRQ